jgi:hypothetical protein
VPSGSTNAFAILRDLPAFFAFLGMLQPTAWIDVALRVSGVAAPEDGRTPPWLRVGCSVSAAVKLAGKSASRARTRARIAPASADGIFVDVQANIVDGFLHGWFVSFYRAVAAASAIS